jgi:hypothetical protein
MVDEGGAVPRREQLERKLTADGLSDAEAGELADLRRGGPAPFPSKLLPPRPPGARPWQRRFWRGRALGPLGALLVIALLVAVVGAYFAVRPSVDWHIYEDPGGRFAMDYPGSWTTQTVADEPVFGGRADGVLVAKTGTFSITLAGVFGAPFTEPSYGFLVFSGGDAAAELRLVVGPDASPFPASGGSKLAGKRATTVESNRDGQFAHTVYVQDGNRLLVLFFRSSSARRGELKDELAHVPGSLRLG